MARAVEVEVRVPYPGESFFVAVDVEASFAQVANIQAFCSMDDTGRLVIHMRPTEALPVSGSFLQVKIFVDESDHTEAIPLWRD